MLPEHRAPAESLGRSAREAGVGQVSSVRQLPLLLPLMLVRGTSIPAQSRAEFTIRGFRRFTENCAEGPVKAIDGEPRLGLAGVVPGLPSESLAQVGIAAEDRVDFFSGL